MTQSTTIAAASKLLGEKVSAPLQYTPEILVRVPRDENREAYGITGEEFIGFDTWNCYEVSFLTEKGRPVSGYGKLVYSANNEFIVESKSLKLYLNSFNMSRFGSTSHEAISIVEETVKKDLSALLETDVMFKFFDESEMHYEAVSESHMFPLLSEKLDLDGIEFTHYNETPEILQAGENQELLIQTNLLRSNCRVTHQPDWGTVYIDMVGVQVPTLESLAQYLVSMRGENHFHEEICETIYKRLHEHFEPASLMVTCLYTRRGGIDICPARASNPELLLEGLANVNTIYEKTPQQ